MEFSRFMYTLAGVAVLPLLPVRLWWRGRTEPGYRRAVGERFGRYRDAAPPGPVLWVHAVSVGETQASAPLVAHLESAYPDATIVLTHMTATGRDAGRALYGDRVVQAWLPYDIPFAVSAFLHHFRPVAGFVLETELWPNLVARAYLGGTPIFLINARLSARSAAGYARVASLSRAMLGRLRGVAAQSSTDADRLAALGAPTPIAVTGNIKFDVQIDDRMRTLGAAFRARFGAHRRIWIAASTRDGEEVLLIDALTRAPLPPDVLLLIVPRHPQRFEEVASLLRERRLRFVRRSDDDTVPADVSIVLGDSMREMQAYYAASDIAFVGGSLLPYGAHSLIEPIAAGLPVIVGPHTFNFADIANNAIAAGAALRVVDADSLVGVVRGLFDDPASRGAMIEAGRVFVGAHRGAAEKLWLWLEPQLAAAFRQTTIRDRD